MRFLLWAAMLPGLLVVGETLARGFDLLDLPYETTRPEAFVLDGVLRVAGGDPPYRDVGGLPFIVHVYNPLTYVVTGTMAAAFDLELPATLVTGRTISYVATLSTGVLLGAFVRRRTRRWMPAILVFGGLFFFQFVLLTDFYRVRPEAPGLLLTFVGVVTFLSEHPRRIPVAAVAFFLAFAFKQPYVSAPVAAFLYLLLTRRWRDAISFGAILGALLAAFAIAMFAWTGRAYFDSAIVSMAVNDIDPIESFRNHIYPLWRRLWSLMIAAPIALLLLARERTYRYLACYFLVALAWTFYSAGKFGAWLNYYSELGILALLIVSLAIGVRETLRGIPQLALVALFAAHVFTGSLWGERVENSFDAPIVDLDAYVDRFSTHEGRQLITNERLAVHVGNPEVLDWVLLQHLVEKNLFDVSQLFTSIERGEYDYVIVDPHVTTRLEVDVLKAAKGGPYEKIYAKEDWNKMSVFRKKPQ